MKTLRSFVAGQDSLDSDFNGYRTFALDPLIPIRCDVSSSVVEQKAVEIFEWAKKKGALYYTFLTFPQNDGITEKQDTFLDLDYFFNETLTNTKKSNFSFQTLGKSETDGSSFPSGGLRYTHSARAYTVWDPRSEVFLRNRNKVLYIPSLMVTHTGQALDDKTVFRKAETVLETKSIDLLRRIGIKATAVIMALGQEQEFFVFSNKAFEKRLDLKHCGRSLIGKSAPKNQQFSDHYYGKLPTIIEEIFREAERELLEIGVPCKTRHKEVAANQYEFCPLFEEAGKSIDHNMILMEVLKERFKDRGLVAHFYEKPFAHYNGSGKHCNYSFNYIGEDGSMYNLFGNPKTEEARNTFRLFILIQLLALQKHSKLYLTAISSCGNELRLGGHEAPPRIMSAFLGESVSAIIDAEMVKKRDNLKDKLPNLPYDLLQEDTDRNRTSPFAYAGNKFEFRAVGSSQNASFPMAVIAATTADAIQEVLNRLDQGKSVEEIIEELVKETESIRFNGNGYSSEWAVEAKRKGLYVNEIFTENIENYKIAGKVFVDMGILSSEEVNSKYENMRFKYINTVSNERETLLHILGSEIIPRLYSHLRTIQQAQTSSLIINEYSSEFVESFEKVLQQQKILKNFPLTEELISYEHLRNEVNKTSDIVGCALGYTPKASSWPEFEDFINVYE